ncbi:MAG: proline dehydrogenase family protein [Saprospiraceae bacterium]|nr:proline dehydrogenase family protein [Saprospiraceae bacterium]
MKKEGKPVIDLQQTDEQVRNILGISNEQRVDFKNSEIAFGDRSNKDLRKMAWLFGLMNKHWLVGLGSKIGLAAVKLRLPFVKTAVKNTIFEQFCGGTTLLNAQPTIDRLYKKNILTILDYGAEGKETEEDFNLTMNETIRAIEFAATNKSAPMVSCKVTGLARFDLLEAMSTKLSLSDDERWEYKNVLKRLDAICHKAAKTADVSVLIDAEESWIQPAIDHMVNLLMRRYNTKRAVVYNTFQMYRTDRLEFLTHSYDAARKHQFILGAKLVRGAYMEKERARAAEKGYASPINPSKEATDDKYNTGLRFCLEHFEQIATINASHNANSCLLMADLIREKNIPRNHPHLMFCQLYGMSDNLTYNLAYHGYTSAKYVVYGSVWDVVPYLIRRASENTSVTGDMSREYSLVMKEMKRRGLHA